MDKLFQEKNCSQQSNINQGDYLFAASMILHPLIF